MRATRTGGRCSSTDPTRGRSSHGCDRPSRRPHSSLRTWKAGRSTSTLPSWRTTRRCSASRRRKRSGPGARSASLFRSDAARCRIATPDRRALASPTGRARSCRCPWRSTAYTRTSRLRCRTSTPQPRLHSTFAWTRQLANTTSTKLGARSSTRCAARHAATLATSHPSSIGWRCRCSCAPTRTRASPTSSLNGCTTPPLPTCARPPHLSS
mmetsp:Transcript_34761/g.76465  ORF Transcript_34761/g.76465 Transcript_34761/m.76465 type:complete len:211 (+) Transcript_34761:546-1178(+)